MERNDIRDPGARNRNPGYGREPDAFEVCE
jgi:hypothetical protein